jgi:hypothetical protein
MKRLAILLLVVILAVWAAKWFVGLPFWMGD